MPTTMPTDAPRGPGPLVATSLPQAVGTTLAALLIVAVTWARYPPPLPSAPELSAPDPAKLAAIARTLLAFATVNLAALGVSGPLRRLYRTGDSRLGAVLRVTFGLYALAHVVLALGLVGLLSPRSLGLATVLAALAGVPAVLTFARGLRGRLAPAALPRWPAAAWLAVLGLLLPLLSAFVPVYGWDALTYHLALPEWFLRTGRVGVDPFSMFSTFPLLTQMLYALALALDGPALAKLLHLELAALLVASLVVLAGRVGPTAALFAVLCLLADPLFVFETTVVYTDLPLALVATLAAQATLEWDREGQRHVALRAALLCGLAAGIRYQGALVGPALAVALALVGRQAWRRRLLVGGGLLLGTLALLAPWLLRNLLATGSLFGETAFDPVFLRQMQAFHRAMGMGRGLLDLLLAPWNLVWRGASSSYIGSFGFRIGPLGLLALLMGLAAWRRRPEVRLPLLAAGSLFLAWFFTSQEARFLLPALALVVLAGAWAFEDLAAAAPARLRAVLVATCCAAAVPVQLEVWQRDFRYAYRAAVGDIPWSRVEQVTPAERLGERLRRGRFDRLRVLALFESRTWHLRGVDSIPYHVNQGAPTLLAVHRALAERRLCRWLEEQRVTHVLLNAGTLRSSSPSFVEGYSRQDYESDLLALDAFLGSSAALLAREGDSYLLQLGGSCREPPLPGPAGAPGHTGATGPGASLASP